MKAITIWNKGRRQWDVTNAAGEAVKLNPQESVEMEEAAGLRFLLAYPRELTSTKEAGPSASDLKRREQSLRDREANLDSREKALNAKEAALAEVQSGARVAPDGLPDGESPTPSQAKRGPGRPAKAPAEIEGV